MPDRLSSVWRLFDLRRDQQDADQIDAGMHASARFAGTNLWVLLFAVLIASVGLNVNSTAVIIGAMLISPLMGPIVAIGYAAAVHDLGLMREAARNLAVFVALSLATAVLYFALSPLDEPQSELLARTSPTLWDVLIAAFGGAAGMVAATRKSYSNIVPGVAIATALMPPLCTAGFGAAHARWDMSAGALFLFLINGVFIGTATLGVAKLLRLPRRGQLDASAQQRVRLALGLGLVAVLLPSVWLGWRFAHEEFFRSRAQRVAQTLAADPASNVVAYELDARARTLQLTLVGGDEKAPRERAQALLAQQGLGDATIKLRRAGDAPPDIGQLRTQLQSDLNRRLVDQLRSTETQLQAVRADVQALREAAAARATAPSSQPDAAALLAEVRAQRPEVQALVVALGTGAAVAGAAPAATVVVLDVDRPLPAAEQQRLQRWLAVRLQDAQLQLIERKAARGAAPR